MSIPFEPSRPSTVPTGSVAAVGSERWFAEKVQPHEGALRTWLKARFPTLRDVDDIVQETYARIFKTRADSEIQDVRPYLFSVARNAAYDIFRKKKSRRTDSLEDVDVSDVVVLDDSARDQISRDQELELLQEAISALPDRCRQVVTLRKLYGLSYRQIAERFGTSENTVAHQLTVGLARCRQYLVAKGISRGKARNT